MNNCLHCDKTNKENLLLNSQIPPKAQLFDDDYVLISSQDKNIQKDYIVKISDLREILQAEVTEALFQNIKADDNIKINKSNNAIYLSYDDTKLKILLNKLTSEINQLKTQLKR
jgi:Mor family transcriptional regulator